MSRKCITIDLPGENLPVACDNCEWAGTAEQLREADDACLTAGDPSPAGRCPECEALAYLKQSPRWTPVPPAAPIVQGVLLAYNAGGNWAFAFTDTMTGDTVRGTISGGESNINAIRLELNGGQWPSNPATYVHAVIEMPVQRFAQLTREWPYAGCVPKDLADYVRKSLAQCDAARHSPETPVTM